MMKKLAILLLFLATGTISFSAEKTVEKTFDVSPNVRFSLDHYKGKITIRTGTAPTASVKARIYLSPSESDYSEEECQKIVDMMNIKFDQGARSLSVDLEDEPIGSLFSSLFGKSKTQPFVDFDIMIPEGASLKLDSYKGTFDIVCPSGPINFESYKGTGNLSAVRNDLRLETYKGELDVDVEELHDLDIETYKGYLEFQIQDGTDFTVHGETHKGDLKIIGREVSSKRDHNESSLYFREGSGQNRIDLDTYKGTIKLNFAG